MSSREAPGDLRAGPSWRTCRAAAHTMPCRGVRAESTYTLRAHTGAEDAAVPQPRGKGRTRIPATTLPGASPLRGAGVSMDREPLWVPAPRSHVHEAGPPRLGGCVPRSVVCLCLHAHGLIFLKRPKIFTGLKLKRKQEKPFKK